MVHESMPLRLTWSMEYDAGGPKLGPAWEVLGVLGSNWNALVGVLGGIEGIGNVYCFLMGSTFHLR